MPDNHDTESSVLKSPTRASIDLARFVHLPAEAWNYVAETSFHILHDLKLYISKYKRLIWEYRS